MPGDILDLDFDGVSSYTPLPEGNYLVRVVGVERKQGSKAPYLAFTLAVEQPTEYANRKLFENVSLSDAARWKLKQALEALTGKPIEGRIRLNLATLAGKHALVTVTQDAGKDGNIYNDVGTWTPARVASPAAAPSSTAAPSPTPPSVAPTPAIPAEPAWEEWDDLPF